MEKADYAKLSSSQYRVTSYSQFTLVLLGTMLTFLKFPHTVVHNTIISKELTL